MFTHTIAKPYPLGATLTTNGCNFAIYAPNCATIELAIFDNNDNYELYQLEPLYRGIRFTYIEGIKANTKYAYVCKYNNENYLIVDPYAKKVSAPFKYEHPFSAKKSWLLAKAQVIDNKFDWQEVKAPLIPLSKTILLETHVKGFTMLNPLLKEKYRGKYLGLIQPEVISYFKRMGITAIQLMPITAHIAEPHLLESNRENYWGYNPIVFMAPEQKYANEDAVVELKTVIRELHRNNIEVILDVVFNHSAEGGETGPVFNLKALDRNYYMHTPEGEYCNYTGCGNSLDLRFPATLVLVMDSLRYWAHEFKVDGFRFDLAATLGRHFDKFHGDAAFFTAIAQDPLLKTLKLIAEPWDIGPDGYQLGHFPDGWNECNDKFKNTMRGFWKNCQHSLTDAATRFMGSRDLFVTARWPYNIPLNYITYHDGFTLQDIVSYNKKHNLANGENNRDGSNYLLSDNFGVEGATTSPTIIARRELQKRNLATSLLFSFGIPHILAADTLSHTQQGNNNAYCQDNEISWINWNLSLEASEFNNWLAYLIHARQTFMVPFIRAFSFFNSEKNKIEWLCHNGSEMDQHEWTCKEDIIVVLKIEQYGPELLICANPTARAFYFMLPSGNTDWKLITDTSSYNAHSTMFSHRYFQHEHSISVFYRTNN